MCSVCMVDQSMGNEVVLMQWCRFIVDTGDGDGEHLEVQFWFQNNIEERTKIVVKSKGICQILAKLYRCYETIMSNNVCWRAKASSLFHSIPNWQKCPITIVGCNCAKVLKLKCLIHKQIRPGRLQKPLS